MPPPLVWGIGALVTLAIGGYNIGKTVKNSKDENEQSEDAKNQNEHTTTVSTHNKTYGQLITNEYKKANSIHGPHSR
jgi:hypothetical protein